ncbi:MAG TPA: NfeD family protein [Pyrinomonadaceae bacterium]|nr:NfeD family protein [Pyrinomonadaceae bacterium]
MIYTAVIVVIALLALSLVAARPARSLILSRRKKSSRLPLRLVGRPARVEQPLNPEGSVLVDGELWCARARSGERVASGSDVRVVGASAHLLEVETTL